MHYISVAAVTEEVAREQAVAKTGYPREAIGRLVFVHKELSNSRQQAFVFETTADVTKHPLFAKASLFGAYDLMHRDIKDGPLLLFGPEVTVGG